MPRKKKKNSNVVSVNFKGVSTRKHVREGEHRVKVVEIESKVGQDSGKEYLAWEYEITAGKAKGRKGLYYNTSLQADSLWNLRTTLEAHKIEVPDSKMDLDLEQTVNDAEEAIAVIAMDDEYDGKPRPKIMEIISLEDGESLEEDYDDNEDDDHEDPPSAAEVNKMKAAELEEVVEDFELDVDLDEIKGVKKKRAAIIEALEELGGDDDDEEDDEEDEDEDDEDDEEEDDEEDVPSEEEINKMKKKELQGVIDDHDLDVDLSDYKGIKKQRAAVIEALDEEDDDEEDDDDDEEELPSKKEILAMDEDELGDVIFNHNLDVDLDDFKTLKKKRTAVAKAAGAK